MNAIESRLFTNKMLRIFKSCVLTQPELNRHIIKDKKGRVKVKETMSSLKKHLSQSQFFAEGNLNFGDDFSQFVFYAYSNGKSLMIMSYTLLHDKRGYNPMFYTEELPITFTRHCIERWAQRTCVPVTPENFCKNVMTDMVLHTLGLNLRLIHINDMQFFTRDGGMVMLTFTKSVNKDSLAIVVTTFVGREELKDFNYKKLRSDFTESDCWRTWNGYSITL
ncbi:hypothetical protein ACP3V3_20345 [Vibrio sp. PNB22_3_1]|uniref:hypothetical protein n=1 Tax=unclassified Vibrio TaxID=2614977 RepID=UPI00406A40F3